MLKCTEQTNGYAKIGFNVTENVKNRMSNITTIKKI